MSDRSTRSVWQLLGFGGPKSESQETEPNDELNVVASDGDSVQARLDVIDRRLTELTKRAPEYANSAAGKTEAAVPAALAALEKQVSRAGREQLKANALAEAQLEQLSVALESLRTADTRREAELAATREQSRAAQSAARLDVVLALLPVVDGLDEAVRSARELLNRPEVPRTTNLVPKRSLLSRLQRRAPQPVARQSRSLLPSSASCEMREALDAWLVGITFVRQRALDVLAAEGVKPLVVEGVPFEPEYHHAVEVVPASETAPPGRVSAEIRRGYLVGNRVLRHAEVAVARNED